MALTPMMRQYLDIKEKNKDCLLFFRLGDFYEMFFEDAKIASKELELTLTGKDCGLEERAPMCGIPYHAVDGYIAKLIDKGYKVAICEQLEDPQQAKGLVERGITRIITPGTVADSSMLKENENSYIFSLYEEKGRFGVSYADISTGGFYVEEAENGQELANVLTRVAPKEILYPEENQILKKIVGAYKDCYASPYYPWAFQHDTAHKLLLQHFGVISLRGFDISAKSLTISAAGALLQYLIETQKNSLMHIKKIRKISTGEYMIVDPFTHRNLELTETIRSKNKRGSLLWLLDKTKTSMGGRLLKKAIEQPLLKKQAINERLSAVDELKNDYCLRSELRAQLGGIYDIERLLARISYGTLDARDALSLKQSLEAIPGIKSLLLQAKSTLLKHSGENLDPLEDLYRFLESAIHPDAPNGIKDGGIIRDGFSADVDKYRDATKSGKDWLASLEQREREETGIKNLKIGFNKVFGYYIEVTKSYLNQVPYRYTRRQTLAGGERYITAELKELEDTILSASDKCSKLEYQLFLQIREKLAGFINALQANAEIIALVDVMQSFAQAAYDNDYVRPAIREDGVIEIKGGRHPVVEKTVRQDFVPNDTYLDTKENTLMIITGPNMAGKSTFMRQIGLIVIMAQIGCFVPAALASISIVDRVFTRVGASDDLASGQSTFMVEMNELASILNNATEKSLLILDEIGRGTSTLDGLSIAWATIEYILKTKNLGAKTLFATHYHELTELEGILPGIKNYSITVKEMEKTIIFLHKIKRGGTDRSFGIEVARLAGLPEALLERARNLLMGLEKNAKPSLQGLDLPKEEAEEKSEELSRNISRIQQTLRGLDINSLTPLEALSVLNDLKQMVR